MGTGHAFCSVRDVCYSQRGSWGRTSAQQSGFAIQLALICSLSVALFLHIVLCQPNVARPIKFTRAPDYCKAYVALVSCAEIVVALCSCPRAGFCAEDFGNSYVQNYFGHSFSFGETMLRGASYTWHLWRTMCVPSAI